MNNKALIWVNIILLLTFFLLIFEIQQRKIDLYEDPVLQHFGMSRPEIINLYDEPDIKGSIGGPGGEVFFYEQEKIAFIFAGESRKVNNLEIFTGREFMGIEIGMTFDQIARVFGVPRERGFDYYEDDFTMVYYLGTEEDGLGEIEVWFSAPANDAPTTKAQIFWKKFWR